ncbi:MAG: ABC transporter permease, partial [Acidimicrobiia bacterium]|nr:ABC transporter permease [Acidimicrobiia bacterium]
MADIPANVFADAPVETEVRSQWRLVLRRFLAHRLAVAAGVVLVVAYLFSYLAEPLTGWGYKDLSPDLSQGPSADHWFGTDTIGHDMFAQSMRGLRV